MSAVVTNGTAHKLPNGHVDDTESEAGSTAAESSSAVTDASSRDRAKKSKRRKKKRNTAQQRTGSETRDDGDVPDVEIEYVSAPPTLDDFDAETSSQFSAIFQRFAVTDDTQEVETKPKEEENEETKMRRALLEDSDDEGLGGKNGDEADAEKGLSKKKERKLNRLSVAELKQLVKKPEVVDWVDVTAADPKLLVHLKALRNSVPVPVHWQQKRKYLQGKRGIEKPPFELPDFIKATGIQELRSAVKEKEDAARLKSKTRERHQPKMGKLDIDYQKLHDAFFKWQTKPRMSGYGDLYYEGKEFETNFKSRKPGSISLELREALNMPPLAPPPWLINMQRYGPPPSYPNLRIPGLNAPIPDGAQWGFHPGGWGKPPVDEFGRPLYGDVFGMAVEATNEHTAPIDRTIWGELEEEEIPSEEEDDEEDEDAANTESGTASTIRGGTETPLGGFETPSGISSSVPSGLETPEFLELRKDMRRPGAAVSQQEEERQLYTVLQERGTRVEGFMATDRIYDVSNVRAPGAAVPTSGPMPGNAPKPSTGTKRRAPGQPQIGETVELALNPEELEGGLDEETVRRRYEQRMTEQRGGGVGGSGEDFSDMVAEHANKQAKKRKTDESGRKERNNIATDPTCAIRSDQRMTTQGDTLGAQRAYLTALESIFSILSQEPPAEERQKILKFGTRCVSHLRNVVEGQSSNPVNGNLNMKVLKYYFLKEWNQTSRSPQAPLSVYGRVSPTQVSTPTPNVRPSSPQPHMLGNSRPTSPYTRPSSIITPPVQLNASQNFRSSPPKVTLHVEQARESDREFLLDQLEIPDKEAGLPLPDEPIPRIPSSSLLAKYTLAHKNLQDKENVRKELKREGGPNAYHRMKTVQDEISRLREECKMMGELINVERNKEKTIPRDAEDRKAVARAITLLFASYFRHVTNAAILKYAFGDRATLTATSSGTKIASAAQSAKPAGRESDPHEALTTIIHLTNFLTSIVQTSILVNHDRLVPLEGWIAIAEVLREQGDAHSLHAILKGLLSPAIQRLVETRNRSARTDRHEMLRIWGSECGVPPDSRSVILRLCGEPLRNNGENPWMLYRSQTLLKFASKPQFIPILDAALDDLRGMGPEAWADRAERSGEAASPMSAMSAFLTRIPGLLNAMGKPTIKDFEWNHWILTRPFAKKEKILEISRALEADPVPRRTSPATQPSRSSSTAPGEQKASTDEKRTAKNIGGNLEDGFPDVLPPRVEGDNVTAVLADLFDNVRAHVIDRNQAPRSPVSPVVSGGPWDQAHTASGGQPYRHSYIQPADFGLSDSEYADQPWEYQPDEGEREQAAEEPGQGFEFPDNISLQFDNVSQTPLSVVADRPSNIGNVDRQVQNVTTHVTNPFAEAQEETVDDLFNNYAEAARRRRVEEVQQVKEQKSAGLERLTTHGRAPYSG
ncbi:hypothetical protein HDU93_000586 [Gonapodya sp. JEL0774]|nr:hypothetical protein HDU93_000586 [Gonapodya sp. JEL0774]